MPISRLFYHMLPITVSFTSHAATCASLLLCYVVYMKSRHAANCHFFTVCATLYAAMLTLLLQQPHSCSLWAATPAVAVVGVSLCYAAPEMPREYFR